MALKQDYYKRKPHRPRMTDEEFKEYTAWKSEEKERLKGLKEEAKAQGIPLDKVKQYWYKSQHYSINVAGDVAKEPQEILKEVIDYIKEINPKYRKIKRKDSTEGHALFLPIADVHLGKLASVYETGEAYNHIIAFDRVKEGVQGILNKCKGFELDKIYFNIGNDFWHVDTVNNTTTKGTHQDVSIMWFDAYRLGFKLLVEVIESLIPIADVHVVFDPDNHSYMTGFMGAQALEAWFRNSKNVTFDVSISHRKYTTYGKNLIGTTHGDGAKSDKLPQLMAIEAKKEWAESEHYYWYTKHLHHKVSKDYMNVNVEVLRSPSGTDSYHHKNGYQHSPKAIEGFIHHKEYGQIARLTHIF